MELAVQSYGAVDILVNNAAITHRAGLLDADVGKLAEGGGRDPDRHFPVAPSGVARQMIEQGRGGAIVNISSHFGHRGKSGAIAYQTAKAGVLNFTRGAAMELAPHGIRVNSVTPTQTGTPVRRRPGPQR